MADSIPIIEWYKINNNIHNLSYLTDINHILDMQKLSIKLENNNDNCKKKINVIFKNNYINYMTPYFKEINDNVEIMNSHPNHPQRSLEWFEARNEKISASSIYKVMKPNSFSYNELKMEKLGIQLKPFGTSNPIMHGVMFEEVSQRLYETRNNVKVLEHGCIPHKIYDFIGASPDGVVYLDNILDSNVNCNYTLEQLSLHGRLLEIKNPYSRIINDTIPETYQYQINVQQEVCNLPVCDYLETNYTYYDNIDKFIEDVYDIQNDNISLSDIEEEGDNIDLFQNTDIQNKNIPWINIASDGKEKGYMIKFSNGNCKEYNEEYKYKGVLFDITSPYIKEHFEKWREEKVIEYQESGMEIEEEYFWKVKVYDIKTVWYDKKMWDNVLKNTKQIWSEITKERQMTDKELIKKYSDKLEIISNNADADADADTDNVRDADIDNVRNADKLDNSLLLFRKRNLKKKSKPKQQIITYDFN